MGALISLVAVAGIGSACCGGRECRRQSAIRARGDCPRGRLCGVPRWDHLPGGALGEIAGALPSPHHHGPGKISAVDPQQRARSAQRVVRRDRAHGPRGPRLPLVVPEYPGRGHARKGEGQLHRRQGPVGGGDGLPLGHVHHCPPPLPVLHRAGAGVGRALQSVDGFFQVGLPVYYGTTVS